MRRVKPLGLRADRHAVQLQLSNLVDLRLWLACQRIDAGKPNEPMRVMLDHLGRLPR